MVKHRGGQHRPGKGADMKWTKAIATIEQMQRRGERVQIEYHRKHMKNDRHFGTVDAVTAYDYNGEQCKAIITTDDAIDETTHIIDEITGVSVATEMVAVKHMHTPNGGVVTIYTPHVDFTGAGILGVSGGHAFLIPYNKVISIEADNRN